ncbi:MAG: alpha/beta fold hydrolase [Actinocatenispora sp.]
MTAGLPLICFPFAGAGSSAYTGLARSAPPSIEVRPVQLPGREGRFGEPLLTSWAQVRRFLAAEVLPTLRTPYAVYGHSMGGLVGYELCVLAAAAGRPPAALVLGACGAPTPPSTAATGDAVDDPEEAHGARTIAAADPGLLEVLLPILRADLRLARDHEVPTTAIGCPVLALRGSGDHDVTESHMAGWRRHTTGPFVSRVVDGAHLFVRDRPSSVTTELEPFLAAVATEDTHR